MTLKIISQRSERWEMPFNVNKCHILHVDTRNQKFDYEMNSVIELITYNASNILALRLRQTLNSSQQCKGAASKAIRMLGFINRNFSFKNKDIILPLYISLVRPHLAYAVQFWSPRHTKDIAKLAAV